MDINTCKMLPKHGWKYNKMHKELDSMHLATFPFTGTWLFSGRTRGKSLGREAMAWGFNEYVLLSLSIQ